MSVESEAAERYWTGNATHRQECGYFIGNRLQLQLFPV